MFSASSRRGLTGRWALSRDPYLFLAPTTIGSVVLIEAVTFEFSEIFGWLIASAIGYAVFCLILFIAHKTAFRNRAIISVPIWWIFALGGISGAIKGATTGIVSFQLGLVDDLAVAVSGRIFAATVLGLAGVPAVAVVMNSLAEFRQERAELIAEEMLIESRELQSKAVIAAMSSKLRTTIESDLDLKFSELRTSLEEKTDFAPSWQLIADDLRTTARETVRDMSHKLWTKPSTKVPDLTLVEVTRAMIQGSSFPLRLILPILLASIVPNTITDHGVSELVPRLALLGLSTSVVFLAAKYFMLKIPRRRVAIYIAGLVAACFAPAIYTHFYFNEPVDAHFISITIIFSIWLVLLTITCGLIDTALKQKTEIIDELHSRIDRSRLRTISEENETIRLSNEMAKYLHGNLQSRLMASAFAIEVAGRADDSETLTAEINIARKSVQTPFDQFASTEIGAISSELESLFAMWQGIISTELSFVGSDQDFEPVDVRNIVHAVEESFSNALRHGMATEVSIILVSTSAGISLSVIDNGIGPRKGDPGLGSSLFNSIAGSNWSLTRGPDGVGAQLNLQITK